MPSEGISDQERRVAKEVADYAMMVGWEKAINDKSTELGVNDLQIRDLLNRALEYNDKADPSGRIHELEDWAIEKQGRSERARVKP